MIDVDQLARILTDTGELTFMVFLRVGTAMALLPAFGERSIPGRIRLALALSFTAIIAPVVATDLRALLPDSARLASLLIGEFVIGLMLGLSLRITVMTLQMAGTIIAQSISLSQLFASAGSEPMTVIGEFLVLGGLALAVTLDLHVAIAHCLLQSYQILTPGTVPAAGEAVEWFLPRAAGALRFALALAMPFVASSLIYNTALGIINRAMPQMMVAIVGAPALTLGGLALLMICAPLILATWIRHLGEILARPF